MLIPDLRRSATWVATRRNAVWPVARGNLSGSVRPVPGFLVRSRKEAYGEMNT
jgi:hypothetical protein